MGNTCACLGGGRDYPVVKGRRQSGDNGEIDISPSGSYRKTEAKYKVPTSVSGNSPTDVNKNKSRKPAEDLGVEKHESEESEKMMNSTESAQSATHVQTFLAPAIASNNLEESASLTVPSAKTHVEVFSLSVTAEDDSPKHIGSSMGAETTPTQSGHINFTDYFNDEKSPNSSSKLSSPGTEKAQSFVEPSKVEVKHEHNLQDESHEPTPVIDFTNYQIPVHSETFMVDNPMNSPSSTSSNRNKSLSPPKTGIANAAFDISDEMESSPSTKTPAVKDAVTLHDSDSEIPNDRHFFFGMESLKFEAMKCKTGPEYEGEEADREIAEIMMALHTIEDNLWTALKPPEDETDSARLRMDAGYSDVSLKREDDGVYDSVLRHLRDLCHKVEDVLRKKDVLSDQFGEDWLKLPDLSSVDSRYDKKTVSLQTSTAQSLIAARERYDENQLQEILDDYKRQQERLLRQREAERRKLSDRLREKIGGRRVKVDAGDEEVDGQGDSDTEGVKDQYAAVVMNTTWTMGAVDGRITPVDVEDDASSEECSSDSISSDELLSLTDADVAATMTLKATLTSDIQTRMADMTTDDFQSIMGMYRKERRSIRDIRDSERDRLSQSLWEKLAEKRRRNQVDGTLTEEDEIKVTQEGSDNVQSISVSVEATVTTTDSQTSPQSSHTQEVATGMEDEDNDVIKALDQCPGVTVEELAELNTDVLSRTSDQAVLSKDEAYRLLKDHFVAVRRLKEKREQEADSHRQRALDRFRQRRQEYDLDESLDGDIEPVPVTVAEDSIEEQCLQRLNHQEAVTQEDLHAILDSYKQQQQSLMEQRIHQRAALNERLRDKLRAAANKRREMQGANDTRREDEEMNPENQIRSMDDAFFQSLLVLKQADDLTPDQLARLIDEHLDLVDEFKKEVKEQLVKRKEERRRMKEAEQLSALVEEDRQTRAHVKALRQQERARTDGRLAEKLQRKKQKKLEESVGEEIAPKKPERKRKSSKAPTLSQSSYGDN